MEEPILNAVNRSGQFRSALFIHRRLYLRPRRPDDLSKLCQLPDGAFSSLKDIVVLLNVCSCFPDHPCMPRSRCEVADNRWGPLDKLVVDLSEPMKSILAAWSNFVDRLKKDTCESELSIYLVCDTRSTEVAELAVAPLVDLRLKSCAVRLSPSLDSRLKSLAEFVGKSAMSMSPKQDSKAFPFTRLPFELRTRILSYTSLITPDREVEWKPESGFSLRRPSFNDEPTCPGFPPTQGFPHSMVGCFCSTKHAAYATWCRCWAPPRSIFQVCQSICEEATAIFYSENMIVVLPSDEWRHEYPFPKTKHPAIFAFVSHMRPSVLAHVRKLDVVLRPFDPRDPYLSPELPPLQQFRDTMAILAKRTRVDNLALQVHLAVYWEDAFFRSYIPPEKEVDACIITSREVYCNLAEALVPLGKAGLRLFRVHLPLPWVFRCAAKSDPDLAETRKRIEADFEKTVLQEAYDPSLLDDARLQEPRWKTFERGVMIQYDPC